MTDRKIDKSARMANQIGQFYAAMPKDEGAAGVASHIQRFWTPKMIAEILEAVDQERVSLNETASGGLSILRKTLKS